jgi:hypothetical protein
MLMTWHTRFSFFKSAADLENDRLRAQIDDAADLVDLVLAGCRPTEPTFYMWKDHLDALLVAGMIYSMEWTFHRGFSDKTFWKFSRLADERCAKGHGHGADGSGGAFKYEPPPWFRDADVARSHRSWLMAQEPESYDTELWPGTPENMPILWPVVSGPVYELRVAKADLPGLSAKKLSVPSTIKQRVVNL